MLQPAWRCVCVCLVDKHQPTINGQQHRMRAHHRKPNRKRGLWAVVSCATHSRKHRTWLRVISFLLVATSRTTLTSTNVITISPHSALPVETPGCKALAPSEDSDDCGARR